jgi:hypothetical protein
MKRRSAVFSSLALATLALTLAGCDVVPSRFGGETVTEERTTTEFDGVEIRGAADTTIVVGGEYAISVRAGSNTIDGVHTSVVGTTLVIDEDDVAAARRVEVTIHAPSLSSVQILGAGTIDISGVDSDKFAIVVAGAGDVTAQGRTGSLVAIVAGTGEIDARQLLAADATARLAGVGTIKVAASATLKAELSGVGEIRYVGDPSVTSQVSGVGSITRD